MSTSAATWNGGTVSSKLDCLFHDLVQYLVQYLELGLGKAMLHPTDGEKTHARQYHGGSLYE